MKEYIHGGDIYRHPDVLDFSANINPLGTPPSVIQAAKDSMERICHYPDACQEKLKQALAAYEQVPVEWLVCGNGAAELIFALVQAVKPKRALVMAPTFAEYAQALESVGCEVNREVLKRENGFALQRTILEKIQKEALQMVFLCNPNNPTGILMDPELLRQIVTVCEQRKIYLVVDECFLDFVPEPELHTLKGELNGKQYLFLLKAFTKRYAMAGLRLGYGITSGERLMENIERQLQPWNVSIPAQEAGCMALKETEYVEEARQLIFRERKFLRDELRKTGYPVLDSQANYLFFEGEPDLYEKLLEEGVMIRDCGNYPGLWKGCYRIAVKLHAENEQLLQKIRKVRK